VTTRAHAQRAAARRGNSQPQQATMHGEFYTAVTTDDALDLLGRDRDDLDRIQRNE
jgi:hypothetical protein